MKKHPGIYEIKTKNGNGYQVKWRRSDGSQASKTVRTLTEAKNLKNQVDYDKKNGRAIDDRLAKISFQDYAEQVFATLDHRPSTARRRDGIMQKHIFPVIGNRQLGTIRRSDIQQLINNWKAQGLAPRSILNHLRQLSLVFGTAMDDDLIIKSPLVGIKTPRPSEVRRHPLSPQQCQALLGAVEPSYRPLIHFLLATGLRWQELVDLEVRDFHALKNLITVRKSKTEAGKRDIVMDPLDTQLVAQYLSATGRNGADADAPLFTSPNGQPLHYSNFRRRVFKPACEKAGLNGVTIHDLRRTHATVLIYEQHDPKVVQERMGHASINTTLGLYAQATEKGKAGAAGAFNRFLGDAEETPEKRASKGS